MQLVIISGPPHAEKSATAEALCARYDRMLHIDGSALRNFLRMGRLRPWDQSDAGRRQRALLIGSACDMARRFLDGGYGVVIDDIVTQQDLPVYREALADLPWAKHFVVLLPALDTVLTREACLPSEWHKAGRLEAIWEEFCRWEDVATIDPDQLAPDLVADRVMALAAAGEAQL